MEYLHNEAVDSLSVLILVKTRDTHRAQVGDLEEWADSIGK